MSIYGITEWNSTSLEKVYIYESACGIMVSIIGNEHGNLSSIPGCNCLYFI